MKLIIECTEQTYSECKKISGLSETAFVIANGKPYDTKGDYISRDALRKEVTEKVNFTTVDGHIAYDKMLKLIDNAQAVEPERPQGEWIPKRLWDNTHIWVCSECGNQNKHGITVEKACWKCGADMRKGGAE